MKATGFGFREELTWLKLVLAAVVPLLFAGCVNSSHDIFPGQYPVDHISITREGDRIDEIWVQLASGVHLDSQIDISIFDGFNTKMSLEQARKKLGEPSLVKSDPERRIPISIYSRQKGQVGLMAVPASGSVQNQVLAFPFDKSPSATILDASLRSQILRYTPTDYATQVHILREVGHGGVTLTMTSNQVDCVFLGLRDGEF